MRFSVYFSTEDGVFTQPRSCVWLHITSTDDLRAVETALESMARRRRRRNRDGALLLAKKHLHDAIAELSHKRLHAVAGGDGKVKNVWLSSRYDELYDAIESSRAGAGGKWRHQLPFWADAFVLLCEIDTQIALMHPAPSGWLEWTKPRLIAMEQRKWRPQDCTIMHQHATTIEVLAKRVETLFSPKPIGLPNACPECKAHIIYRDMDGEQVRTLALQINDDGATCGNCRTNWPIERLPLLGKLLGCSGVS